MKNFFKEKSFLIILIILLAAAFFISNLSWEFCIDGNSCRYRIIDSILRPIYYSSFVLLGYFTFFLFLPSKYFKLWLKWIFSWGFPVSALIVIQNIESGGGLFPIYAREVIIMLSIFFAVVTAIFLAFIYWRSKK